MQKKEQQNCLVCGHSDREIIYSKKPWDVYKCVSCGLGVLTPIPSQQELNKLYNEEYCNEQFVKGGEAGTLEFKKRLRNERHRVQFFRKLKKNGKVLDIGCGYGYFLAACREFGYEVQGLDLSEWAAKYTIGKLHIPVTTCNLDSVELEPQRFDVITMWHFLEHTHAPHQILLQAKRLLKPNGLLAVEVPNYEGTDAQKNWHDWVGWQLPYHLYHFTPKSLHDLLLKTGFEVVTTKNYHSETVKSSLRSIPVVKFFARLIAKLYSGHSVVMIAKLQKKD